MEDLELADTQWPMTYIDHERQIARAVVVDEEGLLCLLQVERCDEFGQGAFVETAGGGVEEGETLTEALTRELREELGAEVEILQKIGTVRDCYNLIHRRNISHYYLCRATAFSERCLTRQEREDFRLTMLRLTWEEAFAAYERCAHLPWGKLLAAREVPVLQRAKQLLETM